MGDILYCLRLVAGFARRRTQVAASDLSRVTRWLISTGPIQFGCAKALVL